jgi:hypothetical protein
VGLAPTEGSEIGEGVGVTVADGVRKGVVLGGMIGVKIAPALKRGSKRVWGSVAGHLVPQPNRNNPNRERENVRKKLVRFRRILRLLDIYAALSILMPGPRGQYRWVFQLKESCLLECAKQPNESPAPD